MTVEVERWLAQLPEADERFTEGMALEGWLIASEDQEVRIVVGGLCLTLLRSDLLRVEEVGEVSDNTSAIRVRVAIRYGARLLDAQPGELFDVNVPSRVPFALATRRSAARIGGIPRFRALERAFLGRP